MALSTAYGSGRATLAAAARARRRTGAGPGGVEFSFIFEPDAKNIAMAFSKWAKLIDDFRPIFTDGVHLFRKHEARHFATEGKSTGVKFPALSKRKPPKGGYRAWKHKHFPGRPILQLTGTLRDALVRGGGRGGFRAGSLLRMTKTTLVVGLDVNSRVGQYGLAHSRAWGPAYKVQKRPRPPVRYSAKYWAGAAPPGYDAPLGLAIAQLFQVYIVKARKEAFGKDHPFAKAYNWRKMRRGVMRLKTR